MTEIFDIVFVQPILNALVAINFYIPDIGIAIILVTIIIKALLWPLADHTLRNQAAMRTLQPELEKVKEKYKDNQETLAKETLEVYKKNKTNPTGSCFSTLLQIPFLIAIFYVLKDHISTVARADLYAFVPFAGSLHTMAFGVVDVSQPNIILAILAGGAQFWQSMQMKKLQPELKGNNSQAAMMGALSKQMMYVFPFVTVFIAMSLPSGLALYWLASTLIAVLQFYIFTHRNPGIFEDKKETDIIDVEPVQTHENRS